MKASWTISMVAAVSLTALGCGDDDGSGGAGGGTSTTTTGPSTTATTGSTGSTTATSGTTTGTTTGTTAGTTTGGGMAMFGEPCQTGADCESGVCHDFPNQGGLLCTLECDNDDDCPDPPSSGCNMMDFCRPN